MKSIILLAITVLIGTGCVLGPDGNVYPAPGVGVEATVDLSPRVYTGSRSNVTIWLPSAYSVADAYPLAQEHCSRWGFYARPSYDWTGRASFQRRLNYSCVNYRPVLSGPHIIIGSPFYRNHYSHWHTGRSVFGRNRRRAYRRRNGRRGGYSNDRPVYTPKPTPRHVPQKRGTFGRIFQPTAPSGQSATVQRGKPWEHNRNKNVVTPRSETSVQRGKPWEHNRNKNRVTTPTSPRLQLPPRRSTFGRSNSGRGSIRPKGHFKSKKGFGRIKPKNSGRRTSKGRLTL